MELSWVPNVEKSGAMNRMLTLRPAQGHCLSTTAERLGFEPRSPFWGLHALQACSLDQLGHLSGQIIDQSKVNSHQPAYSDVQAGFFMLRPGSSFPLTYDLIQNYYTMFDERTQRFFTRSLRGRRNGQKSQNNPEGISGQRNTSAVGNLAARQIQLARPLFYFIAVIFCAPTLARATSRQKYTAPASLCP
jgi:hypothetical protein